MQQDTNLALVKGFGVICIDHVNAPTLLHLLKQGVPEGEQLGKAGAACPEAVLAIR